ncbi:unnamed protein product [Natator depressus]
MDLAVLESKYCTRSHTPWGDCEVGPFVKTNQEGSIRSQKMDIDNSWRIAFYSTTSTPLFEDLWY